MRPFVLVVLATLAGFALRLPLNGSIPPRWDEGWSIAHASLGIGDILTITAADVHPPLYYFVLGLWQQIAGINLFAARFLSVVLSTTAVPLAFVAGRAWSRSARLGVLAAWLMAWLPLGVYYGAVVRMYSLAPSFLLLALYGLATMRRARGWHGIAAFTVGAAGAMLTLYHAVWPLAAMAVYFLAAALAQKRWVFVRRFAIAVAISLMAFAPWGVFAVPQFLGRAAAETATNIAQQYPITYFLRQGVLDLTMSQVLGDAGPWVFAALLLMGLLAAWVSRRIATAISAVSLPVLMIGVTLVGVAFAARQWAFNARMLIGAVPALALALAWAFERMWQVRPAVAGKIWAGAAAITMLAIYAPTSVFVYGKTLEVFDPYNPNTYRAHIAPLAQANDVVFFNVLSPGGFYALDRQPSDPRWSYALTWDPVKESPERWKSRIVAEAMAHQRFWLVLYRGLAGKNGDLRGFMDSTYYPAHAEWGEEEVFYGLYGVPRGPMETRDVRGAMWPNITLDKIRVGSSIRVGDIVPVMLMWRASAAVPKNYKVFVHVSKPDGFAIGQHDSQPLNDLRPMTTWPVGQVVQDNHGVALPLDYSGEVQIAIGIYDPDTGQRLRTTDGRDAIVIEHVSIAP